MPGYGTVWFDPNGIANILSLSNIKRKYRVTFDSGTDDVFHVHKPDGTSRKFVALKKGGGLYFMDTADNHESNVKTNLQVHSTSMVSTVTNRKQGYSSRDIARADLAKRVQEIIGRPSTIDFISIINNNSLPNCKVTVQDIKMAEDIYGPNLGSLKGKTTRDTPSHVHIQQPDPIPTTILERYHEVTLCIDIMYINNIPFMISTSRHIKFGTAERLLNRQSQTIIKAIRGIYNIYAIRGFIITIILGDNEFETFRGMLAGDRVSLNITAANEHVPEVERYIRTMK